MNRFLILFACFNLLAGCQEPTTIVVQPPDVIVNVVITDDDDSATDDDDATADDDDVTTTDDDDSAADDDDSTEPPTPEPVAPSFTMAIINPTGTPPVQVVDGPVEGMGLGSVLFLFEGGAQELVSFPLSIFHRAVASDVASPFLNEMGDMAACSLLLPDGNVVELAVGSDPGWWVTLPAPIVHTGPEPTSALFHLTCDIGAPVDGNADAYALGVNATAVIAVTDVNDDLVDGLISNNGQWLYPNAPEPSELYPSFFVIVNPEPYPVPTLVVVHDPSCESPAYPINLVTVCFTATAHEADMSLNSMSLDVDSSDNFASNWNTCSGPLGQDGGIWLRRQDDPSTPLGTFAASSAGGLCSQAFGDVESAENSSVAALILDGETLTFQVVMDASWASATADDFLYAGIIAMTATTVVGDAVAVQGVPFAGSYFGF